MQFIQSIYTIVHHNAALPQSQLDIFLLTIKSLISVLGTLVIVVGVVMGLYRFLKLIFLPKRSTRAYGVNAIRRDLGKTIVLGLEFIIAADVIETTTTPDYYSLGILAIIVMIRTFLSFSLSREISQLSPSEQKKLAD
jgi:uncharacterized membrane protein